jgi:hypothetical protein
MYALSNHPTQRPARPRHLAGLGSSVQAPRDLEADLRRLRSRRNLDLISLGVSGAITLVRISTDYDRQVEELRAAQAAAAMEAA